MGAVHRTADKDSDFLVNTVEHVTTTVGDIFPTVGGGIKKWTYIIQQARNSTVSAECMNTWFQLVLLPPHGKKKTKKTITVQRATQSQMFNYVNAFFVWRLSPVNPSQAISSLNWAEWSERSVLFLFVVVLFFFSFFFLTRWLKSSTYVISIGTAAYSSGRQRVVHIPYEASYYSSCHAFRLGSAEWISSVQVSESNKKQGKSVRERREKKKAHRQL